MGPNVEETQANQEPKAAREGGGRGWGGGRGRARLTIQSGLPVGSHSQEGLGEDPEQMQKKRRVRQPRPGVLALAPGPTLVQACPAPNSP